MKVKLLRILAMLAALAFALTAGACAGPYHHHNRRTHYYHQGHQRGKSDQTPPGHRKHKNKHHDRPGAIIFL